MKEFTPQRLLKEAELAKYLGVTKRCIQKMRQTGNGPEYFKLSNKLVRYRLEIVDEWINSKVSTSTSG